MNMTPAKPSGHHRPGEIPFSLSDLMMLTSWQDGNGDKEIGDLTFSSSSKIEAMNRESITSILEHVLTIIEEDREVMTNHFPSVCVATEQTRSLVDEDNKIGITTDERTRRKQ